MKLLKTNFFWRLFLILFVGLFYLSLVGNAQNQDTSQELGGEVTVDAAKQEEIHRYMGYERLLPKYVSLPYDVNMNVNVQGSFIDISYLLLMFLPLILLLGIKDKRVLIGTILLLLLLLLLSITTAYAAFNNISVMQVSETLKQQLAENSFSTAPLVYLKLKITQLFTVIYLPIDNLLQPISGEGDYITLPIVYLLFIGLFLIIEKRFKFSSISKQCLTYFALLYGFLWLILGAGIVWYGILLVALGLSLLSLFLFKRQHRTKWLTNSFLVFASLWLVLAFVNRSANYYYPAQSNEAKGAIMDASLLYGTGKMNETQILSVLFPQYETVLKEINKNPTALVYRIGTNFNYFIANNNERVLEDNQLGFFNQLSRFFPEKEKFVEGLKQNNFKYILVDLNTATIDQTPDKSLTSKYKKLLLYLKDNEKVKLITTDRIIKNGKVEKNGTFAAFEII